MSDAYVYATLEVQGNKLDFTIENSKSNNFPAILPKPQGGIGLINVRRRLELIYPESYSIDIDDEPQAYTVHLSLNLDS